MDLSVLSKTEAGKKLLDDAKKIETAKLIMIEAKTRAETQNKWELFELIDDTFVRVPSFRRRPDAARKADALARAVVEGGDREEFANFKMLLQYAYVSPDNYAELCSAIGVGVR